MNLKEILTRKSPSVYSIEECVFVVEKYIYQEKSKNVIINIYKGLEGLPINHPMFRVMISTQLRLLNDAFLEASNKIKI